MREVLTEQPTNSSLSQGPTVFNPKEQKLQCNNVMLGSWQPFLCLASVFPLCFNIDIDQLKLIMLLVGTPGPDLLMKISSDSVSVIFGRCSPVCLIMGDYQGFYFCALISKTYRSKARCSMPSCSCIKCLYCVIAKLSLALYCVRF